MFYDKTYIYPMQIGVTMNKWLNANTIRALGPQTAKTNYIKAKNKKNYGI